MTMKNLLKLSVFAGILLSLSSCSVESIETIEDEQLTIENSLTCSGLNPEARLTNNGTVPFGFKIYNSNFDMIVEHLNVAPGSSTTWGSFPEGDIFFSIISSTTGVADIKTQLPMTNCSIYDLTVDSSNLLLDGAPIDL